MCGIAGFWQDSINPSQINSMLETIKHRGPDSNGQWADKPHHLVLGQQRLAIIDLSPGGHQPMLSDGGRVAITFNGEIYNYQQIRQELELCGIHFRSHSDTEVLLRGYIHWGTEILDKLVGMFAFAIWDSAKEELFLARDRAGEKPLYYAQAGQKFAFASEIQALTTLDWVNSSIDQDALSLYLSFQAVPAPYSIYKGIKKLPPAHAMIVSKKETKSWRYWDPVKFISQAQLDISAEDASEQLEALLKEAVRGQMIADVPLGAFLSGGIDSSIVVSFMTELASAPVKTFTIGFEEGIRDESSHAAEVAAYLGTDHTCEYLTMDDALKLVSNIPTMYGEPFADASALPTYLVSKVARQHVTVSLSGDGGDEAFGGYDRYSLLEKLEPWIKNLGPFGGAMRSASKILPRRAAILAPFVGRDLSVMYQAYVGRFNKEELLELTGHHASAFEFERAWQLEGVSNRRKAMLTDMMLYMPEVVLAKVDRAAMAVSLETRAPLLDHRILEFALRLPDHLVKDKFILKELLYKRVPRKILERPKQGFGVPLRQWMTRDLKDLLIDTVTPAALRDLGIENYKKVNELIAKQLNEGAYFEHQLWSLLVLCMWHKSVGQKVAVGA